MIEGPGGVVVTAEGYIDGPLWGGAQSSRGQGYQNERERPGRRTHWLSLFQLVEVETSVSLYVYLGIQTGIYRHHTPRAFVSLFRLGHD